MKVVVGFQEKEKNTLSEIIMDITYRFIELKFNLNNRYTTFMHSYFTFACQKWSLRSKVLKTFAAFLARVIICEMF